MRINHEITTFVHVKTSIRMKVFYCLLYTVFYLLSLLPLRVHYFISDILYYLLYYVVRYRVRVVRQNLATSFPEKSEAERRRIEKDFYNFFCDYLVESVKLLSIKKETIRKRLVFKNIEEINRCIEEGQSCAVYLGHYGCWEWVTSLPLWVTPKAQCGQIYHPIENKAFDRLFLRLRQHLGSVSIPMNETLRKLLEYKKANQPVIIGYISDQKPLWVNIHHWVDFLNHDTPVLTGVERIVKKFGHAAFYGEMRRVRRGYYEMEMKLITREPQALPDYELTDAYYRFLEESIRREPGLWLWSHKRWARTREEFNRRFEVVDGKVIEKKQA